MQILDERLDMSIKAGMLVRRYCDSGIGTNRDRYYAWVEEIREDKAWLVNCTWYELDGTPHDIPEHSCHVDLLRPVFADVPMHTLAAVLNSHPVKV